MKSNQINIADNFFGMIKNLNQDVRLDLMNRISNSLKKEPSDNSISEDWYALFGAFESSLSAEKIIDELRTSRTTNRKIEEF